MATSDQANTSLSPKEYSLLLVSTLTVMSGATIAPALPEIAKSFPAEDELTIQLILTMPALFAAFGSLFVSGLIEKFGRIKLLTVSILVYGIAGSSGLYIEDIGLLLVSRAVLGLTVAAIMTTATTLIGDYYHGELREKMIGIQAAFMTFAGVVFISAGGFLAEMDWHAPFAIYLLAFVFLLTAIRFLDEPVISQIDHTPGHVTTHEESIRDHSRILLFGYLMGFLASTTLTFMIVFLPFYLESDFGKSATDIGVVISLNTLFAGIAALLYKRVVSLMNQNIMFAVVFAIMGIGYVILGSTDSYNLIIFGLILMGIAFGWLIPNIMSWFFGHIHGPFRSRAIGGFTFALFAGQFLSPIIGNLIRGNNENSFVFSVTGYFLIILGVLFISHVIKPPEDTKSQS